MNTQILSGSAQTAPQPSTAADLPPARVHPGCFHDKEDRLRFDRSWSELLASDAEPPITAALMLVHALALGRSPAKAFTPISNPVKLANGHKPWQSLEASLSTLRFQVRQHEALQPVDQPYRKLFGHLDMTRFSRRLAAVEIGAVDAIYRETRGVHHGA
jgi:hypothetical protein